MICPKCNREVNGLMALSRRDGKTMICDTCGIQEALEDFQSQNDLRWIPCSERLPCDSEGVSEMVLASGMSCCDEFGNGEFIVVAGYMKNGEWRTSIPLVDVDAWMKFPRPYKGEEE